MKHILIDFENTQPDAAQLGALSVGDCHIWLFLGATQKMLSADLCEALCRFGRQVHFVRVARSGKNALDFYLAYYLGKITEQDNEALICILSRDTGFDVLVEYLEEAGFVRGIVRLGALTDAALIARPVPPSEVLSLEIQADEQAHAQEKAVYRAVWLYLRGGSFHPRLRHNLERRLCGEIGGQLADADIADLADLVGKAVDYLLARGFITLGENGLLNYHFSLRELTDRILEQVRISRPGNLQKLRNVLLAKARQFDLPDSDAEIEMLIAYCKKQKVFRQLGEKLVYQDDEAPALQKDTLSQPVESADFQAQMECFFARYPGNNRPKKQSGLHNTLKAVLQLDGAQADALLRYMIKANRIQISDGGKVHYGVSAAPAGADADKQIAAFMGKFKANKPKSRASLAKSLQSILKSDSKQTEALIEYMVQSGRIAVNAAGKVSYF